ncbi:MATE family efflux transporter [uncultured Ruminococcus sp.]|uniref:MATE family efflux transporter n=1 Tax=uncultured Ruminococcus sp. TaxID=165186 RepID=UPI0025E2C378|nr:MATE family efflux transporter [uncultured Ruminococcus sp.]
MDRKPIRHDFFRYILANVISSLGVSVYILIDTFFISRGMGSEGLTALNLSLPVFNFINGFGLMFGIGGGSKFSMLYCRTERKETDAIYTNAFAAMLAIAALFEILGTFFSKQVTHLLGADASIFDMSQSYIKTILLFSPAFLMNNLMACFMRNDSAPRLTMLGMLTGCFVNVILDYVFIFRFDMGMRGAALATCISPFISMGVMSIHFITGWNAFSLRFIVPSLSTIKEIVSLGLHSFFSEVSGGIVIMIFNFVIYRISGNTGIAAYGVITNIAIIFTAIYAGIASGIQPLMCRYHGRSDTSAIRYVLRLALRTAVIFSVFAYTAVFFGTSYIVGVFNSSGSSMLKSIAETGLREYFLFMPFMGANTILSVYFTSKEMPKQAQLISLMRGTILIIPFAFIAYILRSMTGVWLTVPIAEMITAFVGMSILLIHNRKTWTESLTPVPTR